MKGRSLVIIRLFFKKRACSCWQGWIYWKIYSIPLSSSTSTVMLLNFGISITFCRSRDNLLLYQCYSWKISQISSSSSQIANLAHFVSLLRLRGNSNLTGATTSTGEYIFCFTTSFFSFRWSGLCDLYFPNFSNGDFLFTIKVEFISEVPSRFSKVFKLVLTFISTSGLLSN